MEDEKQTVSINPYNPGTQALIRTLFENHPEIDELEDDELAQFLADVVTTAVVLCSEVGGMEYEDFTQIAGIVYSQLAGRGEMLQ